MKSIDETCYNYPVKILILFGLYFYETHKNSINELQIGFCNTERFIPLTVDACKSDKQNTNGKKINLFSTSEIHFEFNKNSFWHDVCYLMLM